MKKIENIIESCRDCRYCQKYGSDTHFGEVRLCGHRQVHDRDDRDRFISHSGTSAPMEIPDWCPLETYAEVAQAPGTIILPGLPGLEWMTENLSGFGGTEIDGRTYYTYDEAVAAVEQLGDGWRLPTRGEWEALCMLGSTWDDDLKGRWFGGSVFLEAAGHCRWETGALTNVGTSGYAWSSSSSYAGSDGASYLGFHSSDVYPLNNGSRAYGFPVRCVRNVK